MAVPPGEDRTRTEQEEWTAGRGEVRLESQIRKGSVHHLSVLMVGPHWRGSFRQEPLSQKLDRQVCSQIQAPEGQGTRTAHRGTGAMAATVGRALLQAAVRAAPAWLTGTHSCRLALPMVLAATRAQGKAEGGVEAQQIVVGIAEEVQQHL